MADERAVVASPAQNFPARPPDGLSRRNARQGFRRGVPLDDLQVSVERAECRTGAQAPCHDASIDGGVSRAIGRGADGAAEKYGNSPA